METIWWRHRSTFKPRIGSVRCRYSSMPCRSNVNIWLEIYSINSQILWFWRNADQKSIAWGRTRSLKRTAQQFVQPFPREIARKTKMGAGWRRQSAERFTQMWTWPNVALQVSSQRYQLYAEYYVVGWDVGTWDLISSVSCYYTSALLWRYN
jgi:hypothetical protein